MQVKYFINEVEYDHLNAEQRRLITDKLAEAFGLTPADKVQDDKQDEKQEMII